MDISLEKNGVKKHPWWTCTGVVDPMLGGLHLPEHEKKKSERGKQQSQVMKLSVVAVVRHPRKE
jgi:hypothetical protein